MSVGYTGSAANYNELDMIGELLKRDRDNLNTSLPGEIVSFDPATQTATIKVLAQRNLNGQAVDYPELKQVPVHLPRGGGYVHTFPIKPGDGGQLHFQSRDITSWSSDGTPSPGANDRNHSLADAVFVPGLVPQAKAVSGYDTARHSLRSEDGATYTAFDDAGNFETKTAGGATHVMDTLGNTTITTALGATLLFTAAGAFTVTGTQGGSFSIGADGKVKMGTGSIDLMDILHQLLDILANTNVVAGSSAAEWKHQGSNLTPVNTELAALRDQLDQITG